MPRLWANRAACSHPLWLLLGQLVTRLPGSGSMTKLGVVALYAIFLLGIYWAGEAPRPATVGLDRPAPARASLTSSVTP